MKELTQDYFKQCLHYNPDTGIFTWRVDIPSRVFSGDIAGSYNRHGYIHIKINKVSYLAHRLAWFYVYGVWPIEIDHEDHIHDHNWIKNLSDVTRLENGKNLPLRTDNTSGFTGVVWNRSRLRWKAKIKISGRVKYIGEYKTHFAACYARHFANIKYGFHKNHGRSVRPRKS